MVRFWRYFVTSVASKKSFELFSVIFVSKAVYHGIHAGIKKHQNIEHLMQRLLTSVIPKELRM